MASLASAILEHAAAIRELAAAMREAGVRKPPAKAKPKPEDEFAKVSDTDRAMARRLARRAGLHVRDPR